MHVQNLHFAERKRHDEPNARKLGKDKKLEHNLQYAVPGIGVISLIIIRLLLCNSIPVKTGLIKFLRIVALLLVFEIINLLARPYPATITYDSPFLMLLIMVCIAVLLVPAHHCLEK